MLEYAAAGLAAAGETLLYIGAVCLAFYTCARIWRIIIEVRGIADAETLRSEIREEFLAATTKTLKITDSELAKLRERMEANYKNIQSRWTSVELRLADLAKVPLNQAQTAQRVLAMELRESEYARATELGALNSNRLEQLIEQHDRLHNAIQELSARLVKTSHALAELERQIESRQDAQSANLSDHGNILSQLRRNLESYSNRLASMEAAEQGQTARLDDLDEQIGSLKRWTGFQPGARPLDCEPKEPKGPRND